MNNWEINIKGNTHKIEFKSFFKNVLVIDGEEHALKSECFFASKIDYKFYLDNSVLHFVKIGRKADISVNGKFINGKEDYKPIPEVPKWVYIISAVSAIGGFALFGLLALLIAVIFINFYFTNILKGNKKYTIECFIACTAVQIIIGFSLLAAMAR